MLAEAEVRSTNQEARLGDFEGEVKRLLSKMSPVSEEEVRNWEWRNTVQDHLRGAQLPPRFRERRQQWNCRPQQVAFERCKLLLRQSGAIVALVGPRGVGKTEIAAQLIIERAINETLPPWHRRPPYRKLTDLIAKWKSIYADFGSIETEELTDDRNHFCRDHPFVVIDEIHDCADWKYKGRVLTDVLDRRYANRVDTLLISNELPEQFEESIGDSALSRLHEHGEIITCTWDSFRENSRPTERLRAA